MRSAGGLAPRQPGRAVHVSKPVAYAVLLGALAGAAAVAAGASAIEGVLVGGFAAILILLAWDDWERRVIPNRIVYPALALALVSSVGWADRGPAESLVGAAVAFAVATFAFFGTRGGLGAGDVKMMALVGAMVGYPAVVLAGLLTVLTGGVAAALLLMSGRASRHTYLAYGPFIAVGGLAALLR